MSKFICLEGNKRTGKSTQVRKLWTYLATTMCLTVHETRAPFDEKIRELMNKAELCPVEQLDLLLKDRANHSDVIREKLKSYDVVLCDRFSLSTLAYQGYGHGIDLDQIIRANDIATKGLKPDLTIVLDCSVKSAIKRLENRPLDQIEKDLFFLERVRWGYLELAKKYGCEVVDCSGSVGSTFNQIIGKIVPILDGLVARV